MLDAEQLIATYGLVGLGVIIFAEIGLLVGLVLPGETLLVLAGAYSRTSGLHHPHFSLPQVIGVAAAGAVLGGFLGYVIGFRGGPALFHRPNSRLLRPQVIARTHDYFERYGARTVLLARFVPFVRTVVSPAAGVGRMPMRAFAAYNTVGGIFWAVVIPVIGYSLATLFPVTHHVLPLTLAIGTVSVIPLATEWLRHRRKTRGTP